MATVGSPGAETGLICLFGSPGSGKTVLLQEVAAALGAAGHVVMVQPGMVQPGGRPVAGSVILHDDAGWLADDALVRLARQPFPSIVAGPRELADRLLALPVGVRLVELLPVEAEDIPALVADLLGQAGLSPSMLLPEAVAALAERSGGLPRPLRLITDLAIFMARLEAVRAIMAAHVHRAAPVIENTGSAGGAIDADDESEARPAPGMRDPVPPGHAPSPRPRPAPLSQPEPAHGRWPVLAVAFALLLLAGAAAFWGAGLSLQSIDRALATLIAPSAAPRPSAHPLPAVSPRAGSPAHG